MNTVMARARSVAIVLGVAAALVLGFGPRAEAEAPAPTPTPVMSHGGPQPVIICGGIVWDLPHICSVPAKAGARSVPPVFSAPKVAHSMATRGRSSVRHAPIVRNGDAALITFEAITGRIQ